MSLELTSPKGTNSTLLSQRRYDYYPGGYIDWSFMSVHFWGEDPSGKWMLNFKYQSNITTANITNVSVTWYGTSEVPVSVQNIPSECDPLCKRGCARTGAEYCDACSQLRHAETLECINECPQGHIMRNNYCYNGSLPEPQCVRNITGKNIPHLCTLQDFQQ